MVEGDHHHVHYRLPKSTVYRRIKKLVRLGYLVERREKGKIWYEVGTPHGEKSEDHTNV
ncbi:hypothetical protein [Metallosphaera yellowstonensis]|uniref:hypothetical protein n=1 Tax=Metallosphaera yellowstonensis TaxID=1111107 RepID=UPI000AC0DEE1